MTPYLDWTYYLLLLALCVVGLIVNVLGLPGLWLIVLSAIGYAWMTAFAHIGLWGLGVLVGLALVAELVEFLAGSAGAKAAGSSKRGMIGAVIGGFVGGIVGTPLIPIPIVGTIVGAVAGSFAGAAITEFAIGRTADHSFRVGVGAAKGRFWGILSKTLIGLVMTGTTAVLALPLHRPAAVGVTTAPTPAVTQPTARPATWP